MKSQTLVKSELSTKRYWEMMAKKAGMNLSEWIRSKCGEPGVEDLDLVISFAVEDEEKALWEKAAEEAGMSLSEWVADRCNARASDEDLAEPQIVGAPICAPEDEPPPRSRAAAVRAVAKAAMEKFEQPLSPPICAPEAESRTRKPSAERRFACARCKRIGVPSCDECRKLNEKR